MSNLQSIIGDPAVCIDAILDDLEKEKFDLSDFVQMDHICYRAVSSMNYEQKKIELTQVAELLGETTVNGRPIATFRLYEPIRHKGWRIDALELAAPKAGVDYSEGLEHVEFVLFDSIPTFLQKYEGQPFNLKSANRGINPEIGLKLGDYSVKFHLLSLTTVLFLEKKLGIEKVDN